MAYANAVELTVNEIKRTGTSVTKALVAATATHGNKFKNDGRTVLRVKNGSAAPIVATIDTPGTVEGLDLANPTVTLAATGDGNGLDFQDIGPFSSRFNQADGCVWVVFDGVATLTVGAFRLP